MIAQELVAAPTASEIGQWASTITVIAAIIVVVISKFWTKPIEKEQSEVSVADATLNLASGTIHLVTQRMHAEFERLNKELDQQREDFAKERAQHLHSLQQERAQTRAIRKELDEALTEVHTLRTSIREAQAEADKWKRKYEQAKAAQGS